MSDSLPEKSPSEILKVLKLVSGEEVVGLVTEADTSFITFKYPAVLTHYMTRDDQGNMIEYVRLLNYISNIKDNTVSISKSVVIYLGTPAPELEKMYDMYLTAVQMDPKSINNSVPGSSSSAEPGLILLNELFNNEDFVGFVNDLIDTFDGLEITEELEDALEEVAEADIEPSVEPEPKRPPKRKKRKAVKPETNKLPYDPNASPDAPESWSDNPEDYI